jgi:hypothetical protein
MNVANLADSRLRKQFQMNFSGQTVHLKQA